MTLTENQVKLLDELERNFKSLNNHRMHEFHYLDEIFEKSDEKIKAVKEIKAYNESLKKSAIENYKKEVTYVANQIKNRYEVFNDLKIEFSGYNDRCYFHNKTTCILDAFMNIDLEFRKEEKAIYYNQSRYSRITEVCYKLNSKTTNSIVFNYLDELFKSETFKKIMQAEYEKRA